LLVALAAVAILAFPYISLGIAFPIGRWDFDAPVADLAVLAALPLAAAAWWQGPRIGLPGPAGWAVLLAAGLVGSGAGAESLHVLLRKPVFLYLAYGAGLSWIVARAMRRGELRAVFEGAVAVASVVSLASSVGRIAAGDALWWHGIAGLTNNHKTIAVALAPCLPLLLAWRAPRWLVGLTLAAIIASVARTAWITTAFSLCFFVAWRGRTLASRPRLLAAGLGAALVAFTYGTLLLGSLSQLDALRSRHSLDRRAEVLFLADPLFGAGPGANTRFEASTFPDFRVNGVDAHGVFQKVGSEYGLIGMAGYLAFVASMALRLLARHRQGDGGWPAFLALHVNLLLSTETFSQTHWAVLAVVWGDSWRERA
jgi:hypothetical protein